MQTFLPFRSFRLSARVLDYRRLGKQRLEAKKILQILLNETEKPGWRNHTAVRMWRGYEGALVEYAIAICKEWRARGYKDAQLPYFLERKQLVTQTPPWLTVEFTKQHQSKLLRKKPDYYGRFFEVPDDLPFDWPV